jgi:pimeloyl-ACP methyl ester carboxylesterase
MDQFWLMANRVFTKSHTLVNILVTTHPPQAWSLALLGWYLWGLMIDEGSCHVRTDCSKNRESVLLPTANQLFTELSIHCLQRHICQFFHHSPSTRNRSYFFFKQAQHSIFPPIMTLTYAMVPLQVRGVNLNLSTIHQPSDDPPILFLHGFGSCKEDLADVIMNPALQHYGYLAYDAPGCGHSQSDDLSAVNIPFLVATAEAVLSHFNISRFHLIGHSMGGLTALLLAHRYPDRILSFVDIKGNLAPEDCFLSRQIFLFPSEDPEAFLDCFIHRICNIRSYGNSLYASTLRARVRVHAVRPIFESMVKLSDEEDLLGWMLDLPCPKMFMFGEENRGLSYLPKLGKGGVDLAQVPHCGHFPMYSNPVEMFRRIAEFLENARGS